MAELQAELQRLSGTTLDAQGSANVYAGIDRVTGPWLDLVGALNTKAGLARGNWLDLEGVLNYLAGTTGLGVNAAAALIGLGYGLVLPGTAGNYVSSPDSVLSPTGDIDIRVKVKLTDWTPATEMALVGKWNAATNQRSYLFSVDPTTGLLHFRSSVDGVASTISVVSTAASPPTDGTAAWVRVTFDVDNGAGIGVIIFYRSSDGITWTPLGTSIPTVVTSIFDSTALVELGTWSAGTGGPLNGTIFYAEVRSGIDGQVVNRFDTSDVVSTGAMLPATLPGWTVNGSAVRKYEDYVRLPGTAGNYLSWPDSAANSVTGDIDIRCKVAADAYVTAANQSLVSKYLSGNVSYMFEIRTDGGLRTYLSVDGTTAVSAGSSVVTGLAAGAVKWLRMTWQQSNQTVLYYMSDDGVTWTQLGTPQTLAVAAIANTTTQLEIGSFSSGGNQRLAGNVYAASVRSGIDGTVVASFDARDIETPWTINGS